MTKRRHGFPVSSFGRSSFVIGARHPSLPLQSTPSPGSAKTRSMAADHADQSASEELAPLEEETEAPHAIPHDAAEPKPGRSRRAEPILAEVAWEVCNQLGGIYT